MESVWVVCESNKAGGDSDLWVFKNKKDAIMFWGELVQGLKDSAPQTDYWDEFIIDKEPNLKGDIHHHLYYDVSDCWGEIFVTKKNIITKIENGG